MSNLLKAEFYKLWRSRGFWGILGLSVVLSAILMLDSQIPKTAMECFQYSLYHTPLMYMLIIIWGALFVGGDFDTRAITVFAGAGHSRGNVLIAKSLSYLAACILILVLPLILTGVFGAAYFGIEMPISMVKMAEECIMILFAICAMGIIPLFCAFCFRDTGRSLVVPTAFFFLMIFLLNSDQALQFAPLLPIGQLRLASQDRIGSYPMTIVIDVIWIVFGMAGAYLAFRRTDLK